MLERLHDYLENSFLPGRTFTGLDDFNTQLAGFFTKANGPEDPGLGLHAPGPGCSGSGGDAELAAGCARGRVAPIAAAAATTTCGSIPTTTPPPSLAGGSKRMPTSTGVRDL